MSQRTSSQAETTAHLLERDGRYFFFQPDIGIIASDEDLDKAHEKFIAARRAWRAELELAGFAGSLTVNPTHGPVDVETLAASSPGHRGVAAELGLFVAKFAIALVIVGTIAGVVAGRAAGGLAAAIDQAVGPAKSISLADVSRKAADIAKDIQSLTSEEKETLRQSIATISRELDPLVDAWRNPPARP